MSPNFTIYGYDDNPRTRIVKIVAAAEGITLNQSLVIPRKGVNKAEYMKAYPLSQGKIPALEGPEVKLTETIAIVYFLAKLKPKCHLLGSEGTLAQEALVMSYVSFSNQELLQTLARWFLPLIPGFTDPPPYNYDAVEAGKKASLALLDGLEAILAKVKWLVGNGPTLADIFVAVVLSRGLQWVLGGEWRRQHPASMAHFERVRTWEPVREVIPEFAMVEIETPNAPPR